MSRNDELAASGLTLDESVRMAKALAHPTRLRILAMLGDGALCVCQLTAALGLAASTVSAHLAELRNAGLLEEDKEGRWVHYRVAREGQGARLARWWLRLYAEDRCIGEDAELIARIRRHSKEELCDAGLDLVALGARGNKTCSEAGR
ncbi:MAG TPA: metalloregulator ArsR/SmtB family transcription factor [Thermoanaerobaculia bacterium]|nr:metalloregulator ArsR/SmtB family transcription factor [Thermoanaerobaculia bacterium]